MIKKFILLTAIFLGIFNFAQDVYEAYPDNQPFYQGGITQFYKEFHQILIDKNLQPCANKLEVYSMGVVIYPDSSIKYIKPENESEIVQNKCTFELTKEVFKYMKGWKPAQVEGKNVGAIQYVMIIPNDLFQEVKDDYDPNSIQTVATYGKGINEFRNKVFQSIDLTRFSFSGTFRLMVTFIVERDGSMSNIKLEESSGLKAFDDMVINGISSIRNKWKPAMINIVPVRSHYKLPLAFSME